jgi:hypothetical protein
MVLGSKIKTIFGPREEKSRATLPYKYAVDERVS